MRFLAGPFAASRSTRRDPPERRLVALEDGDRILVLHSGVLTSYPGQAGVYTVFRLGGGSASDIPEGVPEELRDMGWWAG